MLDYWQIMSLSIQTLKWIASSLLSSATFILAAATLHMSIFTHNNQRLEINLYGIHLRKIIYKKCECNKENDDIC